MSSGLLSDTPGMRGARGARGVPGARGVRSTDTAPTHASATTAAPVRRVMRRSPVVVGLSWLIAGLAVVAAGVGLLRWGAADPTTVTSVRGQTVELYGEGLYRYDTVFAAAGQLGADVVVLALGVPLLIVATMLYRRGSTHGGLLLVGVLAYFLYTYGSAALGTVAYNELFLLYVVLFSASLYAFVVAFAAVDLPALAACLSPRAPRRGPAALLLASGAVLLVVWGLPVVVALARGTAPDRLDTYATPVTTALDLAVILPAVLVAAALVLRRAPLGYLLAVSLLVLEALLAPLLTAQTLLQLAAGVTLTPAEVVGPLAGFAVLAVLAAGALVAVLRAVDGDKGRLGAPAPDR